MGGFPNTRHSKECPCYNNGNGCSDRHWLCTSNCDKFEKWKADGDRINENRRAYTESRSQEVETAYKRFGKKITAKF